MDWIGPAVFAAGVSATGYFVVQIISVCAAWALAKRKFEFDKDLAERKFCYERDLHDHGRRVELAEQALSAIREAKELLGFALIGARFKGEDSARTSQEEESVIQQKNRDSYYLPIQRLNPHYELFSKIYSLRFAFIAYFGEAAGEPFEEIFRVREELITAANILVDTAPNSAAEYPNWLRMNESFRNTLGWGPQMSDQLRPRIKQAVEEIETICRLACSKGG